MPADVEAWAENQLENGVNRDAVVEDLMADGYREDVAETIVANIASGEKTGAESAGENNATGSKALPRLPFYLWIAIIGVTVLLYTYLMFFGIPRGMLSYVFLIPLCLLLLTQLFAGGYYFFNGWRRTAAFSAGGVAALLLFLALGVVVILQARGWLPPVIPFIPTGTSGLGSGVLASGIALTVANILVHGTVVVLSILAGVSIGRRHSRYGAAPFIVLFLVFAGGFALHYVTVTGVASSIQQPTVSQPSLSPSNEILPQFLHGAAVHPPPVGRVMPQLAATSWSGSMIVFFSNLYEQGSTAPMRKPGIVCGGTMTNVENRLDETELTLENMVGLRATTKLKAFVAAHVENSGKRFTAGYRRKCREDPDCDISQLEAEQDRQELVDAVKHNVAVLEDYFGTRIPVDDLAVKQCPAQTPSYDAVNLTSVQCKDAFTATLQHRGTRPLTGMIRISLYNASSRELVGSAAEPVQVQDWVDGERTVRSSITLSDGSGIVNGTPYIASLQFSDTDLSLAAYCRGGNGFCRNCSADSDAE